MTPLLLSVEADSDPATGTGPKDVFLVLNIQPGANPGRYVRLSLADETAVGLVPNPTFPSLPDEVSADGFAHHPCPMWARASLTRTCPRPPAWSRGDARWAPTGACSSIRP